MLYPVMYSLSFPHLLYSLPTCGSKILPSLINAQNSLPIAASKQIGKVKVHICDICDINHFELIDWGKQDHSPDAVGIITVTQLLQNSSQPNPRLISATNAQFFELTSALEHSLGEQGMPSMEDSPPPRTGFPVTLEEWWDSIGQL